MKKRILSPGIIACTIVLCLAFKLHAQEIKLPPVIPPSPQSAEFKKYGDYPVGHFTGVPDISIPLHEIDHRGFKMPITLKYHAAGIKAGNYADTYGLGWSLFAGGEISRTVNNTPDEYSDFKKGLKISETSSFFFENMLDLTNGVPYYGDLAYDEFNVTLPTGASFKFYITNFVEIKVETNPSPQPVKITFSQTGKNIDYFEIVDEHGVKYRFAEFEKYYVTASESTAYRSSWKLSEVTLPNTGEKLIFKYKQDMHLVSTRKTYTRVIGDSVGRIGNYWQMGACGSPGTIPVSRSVYGPNAFTYRYFMSLVPDSILWTNRYIKFNYNEHPGEISGKFKIKSVILSDVNKKISFYLNWFNDWEKITRLDSIRLQDLQQVQQPLRYGFSYTTAFSRFKDVAHDHWGYITSSASLVDDNPNTRTYYDCGDTNTLHLSCYDVPSFDVAVAAPVGLSDTCLYNVWYEDGYIPHYSTKIGNSNRGSSAVPVLTLNRIDYPTRGYTIFEYEHNKYHDPASLSNDSVGVGGGYRIKSISSYSGGELKERKTYKYGVGECGYGFAPVVPNARTYQKTYLVTDAVTETDPSTSACRRRERHFSSNNFVSLLGNRPGVMYPEVTEYIGNEQSNAGKTIYKYNLMENYTEGLKENYIGDYYVEHEANWRYGQLKEKSLYANDGDHGYVLKQKTTFTWTYEIRGGLSDKRGVYWHDKGYQNSAMYISEAYSDFRPNVFLSFDHDLSLGKALLTGTTTTDYFNGSDPLVTVESLNYGNYHGFIVNRYRISKGNYTRVDYKYPQDKNLITAESRSVANTSALNELIARNIVSPVVEEENYYNGNFLSRKRTDYNIFSGLVLPESVKMKYGTNPIEEEMAFQNYGTNGNVRQYSKRNDIPVAFYWGYNDSYPVIKAENCDYATLQAAVNASLPAGFTSLESLLTAPSGVGNMTTASQKTLWKLFNANLRNNISMRTASVTAYTYVPITGMTAQSDQNAFTTYYEYDASGRLCTTRDDKGNILKQYNYHYQEQD